MKKVLSLVLAVLMLALCGCTTLKKVDGQYDKGAIIDMYLTEEVYNFDPQQNLTDDSMVKVISLLFEGLTKLDANGKWQNAMMKKYEIEKDDGEQFSILIDLKDTRWTDGRTVQAADFVYAWKRLLDPEFKNDHAALLYDLKNAYDIKMGDASIDDLGASAVDTYTLRVEFEHKVDLDAFFENCASLALSPIREDAISRYGDDWAKKTTQILTNGPFCLKQLDYGQTLRVERSNYYMTDKEKNEVPDKFVVPYRLLTKYSAGSVADQYEAFKNGELFYLGTIPMDNRAECEDDAVVSDTFTTHTYVFNLNNPLFEKAEVRRALSMAIDREALAELVVFAEAAGGYIPEKVYNTTRKTSFREAGGDIISVTGDVAGAKALLQSAGVTSGEFSITVRNGEVEIAVAEEIAKVWEQLGFKVDVETLSTEPGTDIDTRIDLHQKAYNEGNFDVIAIDANMPSVHAIYSLASFATPYSGNGVDMYSENYDLRTHISGYSSDEYTALIEAAFAETDVAKRAEILHDAEEMLLNDMPVMPILFMQDAYLTHDDLSNVKTTYYGTRDFRDTKLKDYYEYKMETYVETDVFGNPIEDAAE